MPNKDLEHLADFLLEPRESLEVEIKSWLNLNDSNHKANLAKALIALANHGGGFVIIGFKENSEGMYEPDESRPDNLDAFSQDAINSIVERCAEPAFHCDVQIVTRPQEGSDYPIIQVPGPHTTPIKSKRGSPDNSTLHPDTYYIRRPGPHSEAPQSGQEWSTFIQKCVVASRSEMLDAIRSILKGGIPDTQQKEQHDDLRSDWIPESLNIWKELTVNLSETHPAKFQHGSWFFAYKIENIITVPKYGDFLGQLSKVRKYTGWPPFHVFIGNDMEPYKNHEAFECWLGKNSKDSAHADFWRASPEGLFFLYRGYQEDGTDELPAGSCFDLTLPIWRISECLLHAKAMALILADEDATIRAIFNWDKLAERELVAWAGKIHRIIFERLKAHQNQFQKEITVTTTQIQDNLPEIVKSITRPLYELFGAFDLPPELEIEEISRMRGNAGNI